MDLWEPGGEIFPGYPTYSPVPFLHLTRGISFSFSKISFPHHQISTTAKSERCLAWIECLDFFSRGEDSGYIASLKIPRYLIQITNRPNL